jgi:choline dehydrogenase-like flavoprotein
MQFYETDKSRGFVRGAKIHAYPTPGLIFNGIDPLRTMPFDTLWGPNIHAVMRRARSAIAWAANIEDLPEETNRVTLSDKLRDSDGIRAPKVHYRYSANTQMIRAYILERLQEVHRASGVHTMLPVPVMEGEPGHLLGTARMGADPRRSVVDPMGITHDIRNLSIADGSIFVTSGAANPTSTICALALRIARNLAVMINNERRPA